MQSEQILLLPRNNYWEWVSACQDFVLKFDLNLTPDPEVAGRHFYPDQTITLINPEFGFPHLGSVEDWFKDKYPDANLDLVLVNKASELRNFLDERIQKDDPLGKNSSSERVRQSNWFSSEPIRLLWPTDYGSISQHFGVNPDIYSYWGLPGHEGLDIRAPYKGNVYACADGEVYAVEMDEEGEHPYGRHIRIQHADGYKTIYAHLAKMLVKKGKSVSAGDRIALSGATGSTSFATLHLTLKREGATQQGFTHFPNDAIDPTPFLQYPDESTMPADYPWPRAICLSGVVTNPNGSISDTELTILQQTGIEALKIPASMVKSDIARIKQSDPSLFILSHLHSRQPIDKLNVKSWLANMRKRVQSHYSAGVRYFEIHRAPNLFSEGCFSQWHSGYDFSQWFTDIILALKEEFPEANFGFPALSLGAHIDGKRIDADTFLEGADEAIDIADWLGLQSFWTSEAEMESNDLGKSYRKFRRKFTGKMLFVSEFANVNPQISDQAKGDQYRQYYNELRKVPGLGSAFGQVLSSDSVFSELAWTKQDASEATIASELTKNIS